MFRHKYISIRTKFFVVLASSIICFGVATCWIGYYQVLTMVRNEMVEGAEMKLCFLRSSLTEPLLTRDFSNVSQQLITAKEFAPYILYIIIYGSDGSIVSHTFSDGLIPTYLMSESTHTGHVCFRDTSQGLLIRQITAIFPQQTLGKIVMGIDDSLPAKHGINTAGLVALFSFVLIGPAAFIAFFFSYTITVPIRKMIRAFTTYSPDKGIEKIDTPFNDEIRLLGEGFVDMMKRISQMEKDRKETLVRIMETEKLAGIGVLASGIAHEINNPIAGIEMCAYRLEKKGNLDQQQTGYLSLIVESARHIEKIVKDLLQYARRPEQSEEIVDLVSLVEMASRLIQHRLERNEIAFILEPKASSLFTQGAKSQLLQVIINGMINAIDAVEKKGCIRVTLETDNGNAIISIRDSGCGVAPEAVGRAFDPFFTTKGNKGTGLGLYVSYTIVNAHNGSIALHSHRDGGTELRISLPEVAKT